MTHHLFAKYKSIKKNILFAIYAQFFLQLVHTSFVLIFNIYLAKQSYSEENIADILSYRFLGVICCSLPLGLYIKGKALKPIFYYACIGMPVVSFGMLYGAYYHNILILNVFSFFAGISFSCLQIIMLPFIIRNADKNNEAEAISLHHATFSYSMILCSLLITFSGYFKSITEKEMLLFFSFMGMFSIYYISRLGREEYIPQITTTGKKWGDYDWHFILRALFPHFFIAVGAGLTMPFMNLFFYTIHHLNYDQFSLLSFITFIGVSVGFFYIPYIKEIFGWRIIVLSQTSAIIILLLLAFSEFSPWYSLQIAVVCYVLRQPLMNMVLPITAQLVMQYVGEKNQEITSALSSAIWSGSWFVSAKIFKYLYACGFSYGYIFIFTASLYLLGTLSYYRLIISYEKKLGSLKISTS